MIMLTLNKATIIDEDGKPIETYGITCGERKIKDISTDKQKVESLINLCNENNLSPIHLDDVIDDFLVDLQV